MNDFIFFEDTSSNGSPTNLNNISQQRLSIYSIYPRSRSDRLSIMVSNASNGTYSPSILPIYFSQIFSLINGATQAECNQAI